MRSPSFFYVIFFCFAFSLFNNCNNYSTKMNGKQSLFESILAQDSGLDLRNPITPKDSLNILDYNIIQDGGGVAVGDVNGDGFPDL